MKNIKKLLALALVLVLALGMVPFVAASGPADMNVSDYQDFDAIEYKEAVDVLTALGVLQGDQGIFRPTDSITRAEAAKIIAYINLGTGTADALIPTVTGFDDVPESHWASPFIAYCVSKGIFAGYGDGNFGPEDNVTAVQLGKMLLMSVGYGVNGEYEGPGWELAVIDRARHVDVRILTETGESVNYAAPASREEVAQYTFNALYIPDMVSWNSTLNDYASWGVDSVTGTRPSLGGNTFRLYFHPRLDALGFTGRVWMTRMIGSVAARTLTEFYVTDIILGITYANEAIRDIPGTTIRGITSPASPVFISRLVYRGGDSIGQEASLALGGFENGTGGLSYFINGSAATWEQIQGNGTNATGEDLGRSFARGTEVYLIDSEPYDGHADKVVIIDRTPNVVTVMPTTNAQGMTTFHGVTNLFGQSTFELRAGEPSIFYPDDLAINDVILYYTDSENTTIVEKATPISGTLESFGTAPHRATFGETTYFGTGLLRSTAVDNIRADNWHFDYVTTPTNRGIDSTIWLDAGNGMIAVFPDDLAAPDYLVLLGARDVGYGVSARAFINGRVETITVNGLIHSDGTGKNNTNSGFNAARIMGEASIYHDSTRDGAVNFGPQIGSTTPGSLGTDTSFPAAGHRYGFGTTGSLDPAFSYDPRIFAYTEDANGNYTLIRPSTRPANNGDAVAPSAPTWHSPSNRNRVIAFDFADTSDRTVSQASTFLRLEAGLAGKLAGVVGDDQTVFVVRDWNSAGAGSPLYRTYRGVSNAPVFDGLNHRLYAGTVVTHTNNAGVEVARFVFLVGTPKTLHTNTVFFVNPPSRIEGDSASSPTHRYQIIDTDNVAGGTRTVTLSNDAYGDLLNLMENERLEGTNSLLADIGFTGDLVTSVQTPQNAARGIGSRGAVNDRLTMGTNGGAHGVIMTTLGLTAGSTASFSILSNASVWEVRDSYNLISRGGQSLIGENRGWDALFAIFGEPGGSNEFIIEELYIVRWDGDPLAVASGPVPLDGDYLDSIDLLTPERNAIAKLVVDDEAGEITLVTPLGNNHNGYSIPLNNFVPSVPGAVVQTSRDGGLTWGGQAFRPFNTGDILRVVNPDDTEVQYIVQPAIVVGATAIGIASGSSQPFNTGTITQGDVNAVGTLTLNNVATEGSLVMATPSTITGIVATLTSFATASGAVANEGMTVSGSGEFVTNDLGVLPEGTEIVAVITITHVDTKVTKVYRVTVNTVAAP